MIIVRNGQFEYSDTSDPIKEHNCIYCVACVTVCPTQSLKVEEANTQNHKRFL